MPRRSELPAEREARDRAKRRYDTQLAAINDFFTRERRIEVLRCDVVTLEAEQGDAAAKLVVATSVAEAAEILGWTQARVREASGPRRSSSVRAGEAEGPTNLPGTAS